jgi:hypothetical protein
MSAKSLQKQLDELRLQALESKRLNDSTRQHLYKTIASAYVAWRDFSKDETFLEKQYKKAGITYRNTNSNTPLFRPFIRLIFDIPSGTPYYNNKVGHWSSVLNRLHEEYEHTKEMYQHNAVNKLAAFIDREGGITNIVANDTEREDINDAAKIGPAQQKKIAADKEKNDALATFAKTLLTGDEIKPFGKADAKQTLRTDENELVVLIGKRNKDGSVALLGHTNSADVINAAAPQCVQRNFSLIPPALRQLSEVIFTQMYPYGSKPTSKGALKAWRERVYYDQTGVTVGAAKNAKGGKEDKEKMTNPRRVLIRGALGDILFSSMRSPRSTVTWCKPELMLGSKRMDIYLKTNERNIIEDLLGPKHIELVSATPKSSLQKVDDDKHVYEMRIENPYINEPSKLLHFYQQGRSKDNPKVMSQTDFRFKEFKALLRFTVDLDWLEQLRANFLDEWFSRLGKNTQLKRENNFFFEITFTKDAMRIKFNIDNTKIAPKEAPKIKATFASPQTKSVLFRVRSKDISPVFYNLADMPIHGKVDIAVGEDAMVIAFKTDMGDFKIAVPRFYVKKEKKADSCFYMVN